MGDMEEAQVLVRRALKKMERIMAIADTACATHAYPLVDAVPVHPGWQEDDPVLHRVEQAVCSSDYPFIKSMMMEYRNYWKARLDGIRTALLREDGYRPGMETGWEEKTENGESCLEVLCDHVRGIRDTTRNLFLEFRY